MATLIAIIVEHGIYVSAHSPAIRGELQRSEAVGTSFLVHEVMANRCQQRKKTHIPYREQPRSPGTTKALNQDHAARVQRRHQQVRADPSVQGAIALASD